MSTRNLIFKILSWVVIAIITYILGYFLFTTYLILNFNSGCGLDDGPFSAKKVKSIAMNENSHVYNLADKGAIV